MERLWSWDRAVTVREVVEDFLLHREIAYTTVMTVMDNLHRKGYLRREMHGRAYHYRAARSREQHTADLMEMVLSSSTDPGAALLRFVEQMSDGEVALLREALDGTPEPDSRKTP